MNFDSQDALGPQVTIKRSQNWIRVSFVVLGLIIVKIVYLATRTASVFPFVWVLCGIQIMVRIFGLYFVRESIDDIKREVFMLRKATSTPKLVEMETLQLKKKTKDVPNQTEGPENV